MEKLREQMSHQDIFPEVVTINIMPKINRNPCFERLDSSMQYYDAKGCIALCFTSSCLEKMTKMAFWESS